MNVAGTLNDSNMTWPIELLETGRPAHTVLTPTCVIFSRLALGLSGASVRSTHPMSSDGFTRSSSKKVWCHTCSMSSQSLIVPLAIGFCTKDGSLRGQVASLYLQNQCAALVNRLSAHEALLVAHTNHGAFVFGVPDNGGEHDLMWHTSQPTGCKRVCAPWVHPPPGIPP